MRATKYSYSIHGNIVAIVDSLEEDTLPLDKAIEDVVAEISDKEELDSRVYCWLYYHEDEGCWDGYSPCTHTFFDVAYPPVGNKGQEGYETPQEQLTGRVLLLPAIRQKAHFLANNPMIMLEKAYHLNVQDDAPTTVEFFKLIPERIDAIQKAMNVLGYNYTNSEITKGQLFTEASKLAQSANELAYISIRLYNVILPTAEEARKAVKEEIDRQASNN